MTDIYTAELARKVNELRETMANLDRRKALRHDSHARGWMTRREMRRA